MSRWARRLCAAWCLLAVCIAGCTRLVPTREETPAAYVKLQFSTREMLPTRADPHTGGTSEEAMLHKLQVWAFNSGTDPLPLGYASVQGTDLARITDAYGNVSLIIPVEKARLGASRRLDFYIAANAASAGLDLAGSASRTDLEQSVFGTFPPDPPVRTVPADGLPLSRIVRSVDAEQYLSAASNPAVGIEIPLVRSVSKLHFFFARPQNLSGATIRRITLDGDAIPTQTYFFPPAEDFVQPLPDVSNIRLPGSSYHPSPLSVEAPELTLHPVADPELLVREAQEDIQDYLSRLRLAGLQDCGLHYLHESDRPLSGTIYYTTPATGTAWQQTRFQLDAGQFVRGREWIVYAFFAKDRLYVHPVVADWTDGGRFSFDWHYTSTLINQTGNEHTHILTEGGLQYVMSAYGSSPSGLPYAPKLQLESACTGESGAQMILQLDNPDFGFIVDEEGVLSSIQPLIRIELTPLLQTTTFYVVPKRRFDLAGSNPENPIARLKLLLVSDFLTSICIPFNAISLPGDTDYIRFHYVTPDQFR